ncbi:MAG: 5-formyltetrahydrofolate cyclo-ligase [Bdellovibrionales bacterium]|nr:5-formyltetrahydrofolate cyclo-ligase [Bdellovibrionales bacterium]
MSKQKQSIRKEMRKVLRSLDHRWVKAASQQICANVCGLLDSELGDRVQHVLAWTSFFDGEPDLSGCIIEQLSRRQVYLPRTSENGSMDYISLGDDWISQIEPGQFGIPEPRFSAGNLFQTDDAPRAVVLIPGLAFGLDGNRVGRGKGYYDRFLANKSLAGLIKVGVCWSLQVREEVPSESFDVTIDWICHERGVERVSNSGSAEDFE